MTLPGPIPMGGIPDVKPLYHTQLPTLGQTLTPQIQLLMSIMQDKQARKERADKLLLDKIIGEGFRAVVENTDFDMVPQNGLSVFRPAPGNTTQSGIGSDAFGNLAGGLAGGPTRVEGGVSRAIHGLPGEAITPLMPYLTGQLAEGARRRGDQFKDQLDMVSYRAKALVDAGKPSFKHFVTEKFELAVVNETTSIFELVRDINGKVAHVPDTTPKGAQMGKEAVIDIQDASPTYGHHLMVPQGNIDTSRYSPVALSFKGENYSAYNFITPMVKAYKEMRTSQPDIKDTQNTSFLTAVEGALQLNSDGLVTGLAAAKGLNPRTKQWLDAVLRFANARAFQQSGKAVPKAEFLRILKAEVPMLGVDDEQASNVKYDAMESVIGSVNQLAKPLLAHYHSKEPAWETVRDGLRVERAVDAGLGALEDAVLAEHPDWDAAKITNEARRRYNLSRPASEAQP